MGGLFSRTGSLPSVIYNLESVTPETDEERTTLSNFDSNILHYSFPLLQRFSAYPDVSKQMREAISLATEEAKEDAWNAIFLNVKLQMEVYEFCNQLINVVIIQFKNIRKAMTEKSLKILTKSGIVMKILAESFDLILKFDEAKLKIDNLLNELAFFRRNAQQRNDTGSLDHIIQVSNTTTMFWATSMPMLFQLKSSIEKEFKETDKKDFSETLDLLGAICDIAASILQKSEHPSEKQKSLCMRTIVGTVLVYDHLSPSGAFTTKVNFHNLTALELVAKSDPKPESLIKAIKFGSAHFDSPAVDPKIKALFT